MKYKILNFGNNKEAGIFASKQKLNPIKNWVVYYRRNNKGLRQEIYGLFELSGSKYVKTVEAYYKAKRAVAEFDPEGFFKAVYSCPIIVNLELDGESEEKRFLNEYYIVTQRNKQRRIRCEKRESCLFLRLLLIYLRLRFPKFKYDTKDFKVSFKREEELITKIKIMLNIFMVMYDFYYRKCIKKKLKSNMVSLTEYVRRNLSSVENSRLKKSPELIEFIETILDKINFKATSFEKANKN